MLSVPELLGVFVAQPADDSECGKLRLRHKPIFDRSNVRIELGWHANPGLITPLWSAVRGTWIAGVDRPAEFLRKSDGVGC